MTLTRRNRRSLFQNHQWMLVREQPLPQPQQPQKQPQEQQQWSFDSLCSTRWIPRSLLLSLALCIVMVRTDLHPTTTKDDDDDDDWRLEPSPPQNMKKHHAIPYNEPNHNKYTTVLTTASMDQQQLQQQQEEQHGGPMEPSIRSEKDPQQRHYQDNQNPPDNDKDTPRTKDSVVVNVNHDWTTEQHFDRLVEWVRSNGGFVHSSYELRRATPPRLHLVPWHFCQDPHCSRPSTLGHSTSLCHSTTLCLPPPPRNEYHGRRGRTLHENKYFGSRRRV